MGKLKPKKYGIQWFEDNPDIREITNLDLAFAYWLASRFKMYLKYSPVDLEFNKFKFRGKIRNQEEMIRIVIKNAKKYLNENLSEDERDRALQRAVKAAMTVMPAMWT